MTIIKENVLVSSSLPAWSRWWQGIDWDQQINYFFPQFLKRPRCSALTKLLPILWSSLELHLKVFATNQIWCFWQHPLKAKFHKCFSRKKKISKNEEYQKKMIIKRIWFHSFYVMHSVHYKMPGEKKPFFFSKQLKKAVVHLQIHNNWCRLGGETKQCINNLNHLLSLFFLPQKIL